VDGDAAEEDGLAAEEDLVPGFDGAEADVALNAVQCGCGSGDDLYSRAWDFRATRLGIDPGENGRDDASTMA
jgi:hypothetical protein